MSLFKKPKKNLRQRSNLNEDEGETEELAVKIENSPASIPKSSSSKIKPVEIKKSTSTLSFQEDLEEDEGVETFQIKKSSQSRRIAKKMERDRKMKEQQKLNADNTVKAAPAAVQEVKREVKEEVLLPEVQKTQEPKKLILSGREAEMAGYRSESDEEDDHSDREDVVKFRKPEPFRNVLESGSIPDAAMIHAARKHRAQAREMGGLADYVRLEDMPDYEREQQAVMSSARLVREDENDKSDEEERDDGRLDFSVDLLTKDKQQRREAFMAAEREGAFRTTLLTESFKSLMIKRADEVGDGNASDASDDEDGWERQQFQKAIRQRQFESAQQEMHLHQRYIEGSPSSSSITYHRSSPSIDQQQAPSRSLSSKAPDLTKLAPLASPLELQQKLSKRLESLQEVHRRRVNDLELAKEQLETCRKAVEHLEIERPRLSERYHFFQVMRKYIHDLVDCIGTKYYEVEALEKKWFALLGRRHRYLVERRREDVLDESSDIAIKSVIVQSANPDKLARTAEREARRRRRQRARKDPARHKEGLSSDDEVNDKENKSFSAEKEKIREESDTLFADVIDEFSSLDCIFRRFEEWRRRDRASYGDVYVEMFLPRFAGCLVRSHLIQTAFNPLECHDVNGSINKSKWFQTLAQYDADAADDAEIKDRHHDPPVVSKTIELAIFPYIAEVVKSTYDPCSTSQTNCLVKLLKTLVKEHPQTLNNDCKVMLTIRSQVLEKFETTVNQDVFIPFHFAAKSGEFSSFLNRQFWSAAKLLRNILHWQTIIEDDKLCSIAMDKLFKKYMLLPLKTARGAVVDPETLHKVCYIAEAMPTHWLGPMAPQAAQLQPLVDVTISLAQNANCTSKEGCQYINSVADVLKRLGAIAEAQELIVKYLKT